MTETANRLDSTQRAFAAGMRHARMNRGMGVRDLARHIERSMGVRIHFSALSKVEHLSRQVTLPEGMAIAGALGMTVDELVGEGSMLLTFGGADDEVDTAALRRALVDIRSAQESTRKRADELEREAADARSDAHMLAQRARNIETLLAEVGATEGGE